jgi:hypothetical protein
MKYYPLDPTPLPPFLFIFCGSKEWVARIRQNPLFQWSLWFQRKKHPIETFAQKQKKENKKGEFDGV